jgi:hypothetical protein
MNWLIKSKLKKLSKQAEIDREFKIVLKRHLVKQIPSRWYIHILKPVAGVTAIILIFGSTTGAYAYTSNNVLPHHPLYLVRTQIENVESALASNDPVKHAYVAIKHLEKRVHEVSLMEDREIIIEKEDIERVTNAVRNAIETTSELTDTVDNDDRIRRAEIRSTSMFQTAAEGNSELEEVIDESAKDLGRLVWKMDESRKALYENIELRYEAELFGIDWKLEQGLVVVDMDDIETIIEKIAPDAVAGVIKATTPVVVEKPVIQPEPAAAIEPTPEPVPAPAPKPTEIVSEPSPQPEPVTATAEPIVEEPTPTHVDTEEGMTEEEIIRERLRIYFEKLRLQGKL